jgi:hypothetical protein
MHQHAMQLRRGHVMLLFVTSCYLLYLAGGTEGPHLIFCLHAIKFILALPVGECQLRVPMVAIARPNNALQCWPQDWVEWRQFKVLVWSDWPIVATDCAVAPREMGNR